MAQEKEKYLTPERLKEISHFLNLSENDIYSTASFYAEFRFTSPGEHIIKVCDCPACHVKGSENILHFFQYQLNIKPGQTTNNLRFSLEKVVGCFIHSTLSPVVMIDRDLYVKMTPAKAQEVLRRYN